MLISPRSLHSLLPPTVRTAGVGRIVGTIAVGSVPVVVTVARGGTDLGMPLVVLFLVAGAAVGWITDDPAAALLAPCPIAGAPRMWVRLAVAAATCLVCVLACVGFVALTARVPLDWIDRVPELAAAAAVGVAGGLFLWRRGDPLGGATGVVLGLLVPATIAGLAVRWPAALPTFVSSPAHARWWLVAGAASITASHLGRDPGAPGRILSGRS